MVNFSTLSKGLQITLLPLTLYGIQQSYVAIRMLNQYEPTAKKAAKVSNVAQDQLTKTRTTQASGAFALGFSLLSILVLYYFPEPSLCGLFTSIANVSCSFSAYSHIRDFWTDKAQVPLVKDYNAAIERTKGMSNLLIVLSGVWAVAAASNALFYWSVV